MAMPDRPELRQAVSVENPVVDPDKLLGDLTLDLEQQLHVIKDETRRGIDAAKAAAQTQREATNPVTKQIEYGDGQETTMQEQLIEAQALLQEWSDIRLKSQDGRSFDQALKTKLGIERLPRITAHQATVTNLMRRERGEEIPGDDSVLFRTYNLREWLPKYRAILAAAREISATFHVLSQDQVLQGVEGNGSEEQHKRMSFKERVATALRMIKEWKDLVRQSGMERDAFQQEVLKRLGKEYQIDVHEFEQELKEQKKRHGQVSDLPDGDKNHDTLAERHLEEMMPHARAIVAEQTRGVFGSKHGEVSAQMGATPDRSTPGKRDDRPQGKPRMDAVLATSGELERKITNLRRWDHELQFRDPNGNVFLVRPTKNEYMYELRGNSSSSRIVHFRELATLLYEKQVIIDGEYTWQPNALSREVRRTVREGMIDSFGPDELQTWWDDAERTWEDRIRFVQTQLNRWGVVADRFQQSADGARILKQKITRFIPEYEPLALDTGVYETRDLIRQAQELAMDGTLETEEQGGLRNQLRQRCLAYQNILKVAQEASRKLTAGGANERLGGGSLTQEGNVLVQSRHELKWAELTIDERRERALSLERWTITFWKALDTALKQRGIQDVSRRTAIIHTAYQEKLNVKIREKLGVALSEAETLAITQALEKVIARLQ